MKPSIFIDFGFGLGIFLVLALAILFGWQMPDFVYVMF